MLTIRPEEIISESAPEQDSYRNGIRWSFAIHIGLFVLILVKSVVFPSDKPAFQSAIRVDMVGLPDKMDPKKISSLTKVQKKNETEKTPQPTPTAASTPVAKPKEQVLDKKIKPETIALKKAEDPKAKQAEALAKLKKLSAIDQIKNEVRNEQKTKTAAAPTQTIKGNVVTPGTSLSGLDKLQHDAFVSSVEAHAKERWYVPEWLAKKKLVTTVRIKIDRQGNLITRELIKASGNPNYDEAVFNVIDKATPFPAPPEKFIQWMAVTGLIIEFGSQGQ